MRGGPATRAASRRPAGAGGGTPGIAATLQPDSRACRRLPDTPVSRLPRSGRSAGARLPARSAGTRLPGRPAGTGLPGRTRWAASRKRRGVTGIPVTRPPHSMAIRLGPGSVAFRVATRAGPPAGGTPAKRRAVTTQPGHNFIATRRNEAFPLIRRRQPIPASGRPPGPMRRPRETGMSRPGAAAGAAAEAARPPWHGAIARVLPLRRCPRQSRARQSRARQSLARQSLARQSRARRLRARQFRCAWQPGGPAARPLSRT